MAFDEIEVKVREATSSDRYETAQHNRTVGGGGGGASERIGGPGWLWAAPSRCTIADAGLGADRALLHCRCSWGCVQLVRVGV